MLHIIDSSSWWFQYSVFGKKVYNEDGDVQWVGYVFDVIDILAQELNFR